MPIHTNEDSFIFENDRITDGFDLFFWVFNDRSSYVPIHWHTAIEIMHILSGSVEVRYDGRDVLLLAGDVFLVDSRVPHSVSSPNGNRGILLQLPYAFLKKYIPDIDGYVFGFDCHTGNPQKMQSINELVQIILQMQYIFEERPNGGILKFNSLMFNLLYLLYHDFARSLDIETQRPVFKAFSHLESVLSYCEEHYREQIPLSKAAELACLQEEYFCHLFKKSMGVPYLRYLNELRLSHIYRDLLETDLPLGQLLETHGFTNPKLFRKMFQEKFHTTPLDYRKKHGTNIVKETLIKSY